MTGFILVHGKELVEPQEQFRGQVLDELEKIGMQEEEMLAILCSFQH